jgi:hypothetical protein
MATKVFISWSGELSRKLGEALRTWLPGALQYVRPYFTPDDIEKGKKWDSEIASELESSDIGLFCLTPGNTETPWILFEAGALSKKKDKSRVCTILFNLEPTDLKGPMAGFQHTKFVKDDVKKLVAAINSSAGESKLEGPVLDSVFDMWWPKLEQTVTEILGSHDGVQVTGRRPDRELVEEILELTRMNASAQMEGRQFREPKAFTSMILNEMKGIMSEIPAQVAQRIAEDGDPIRRRRLRRFHPMMMEEMIHMTGDEEDPIGILIMASMVRDELPWLYEIAVDAYRAVKSGTPSEVEREIGRLRRISKFVMGGPFMEEFGMGSKETHMFLMEFPHMLERLLSRQAESDPSRSRRQRGTQ